ncbi:physarolisin II. Serine peptidase. MEROPS family S53 [Frankineae bacterium MT45]|nr:physarolisin II. Serine peptidase. MEROPS family S53 [Frankineae bacterium MT45]
MQRKSVLRGVVTLTTVSAVAALSVIGANPANAAVSRKVVPNSAPTWLAHAQKTGTASAKAGVSARVYLAPNGGMDALKAAALAVSTPGNSSYHKFLTTAQYNAKYAPTSATVNAVGSWLRSTGLKVTGVGEANSYLTVTGNVAAVKNAFATTVNTYKHDGQNVQAPAGALSVPNSVASAVLAVSGLDTTTRTMTHSDAVAPPPPSFVNGRPCSQFYGQVDAKYRADYKTPLPKFNGKTLPYAVCGYTGVQFRTAYEGATELSGTGVTVAIVDAYASPTIASDAATYTNNHGDGSYAPGQLTQVPPATVEHTAECDASGWYGEETLDVEAVHAMAPTANIRYYGAKSCYDDDLLDAIHKVVTQNKVQLVTNSYGDAGEEGQTADVIAAWESVFLQGAMQGISFMYSSGDNGDELQDIGLKSADYPASDPYVTAVGGTSTAIDGSGMLAWESGWGTHKYTLSTDGKSWSPVGYLYGAGGGYSTLFNRPSYQDGVVPTNAPPGRAVPDVAMDADPTTGMLVGQTQTFPNGGVAYGEYRIGGTSLASPLFAGMTALTLEAGGGTGLGLLNPLLYSQATSGNFTDVKGTPPDAGNVRVDYKDGNTRASGLIYSVRTFGQDSSLTTAKGWDDVTGIGSPNPGWLGAVAATTPGKSGGSSGHPVAGHPTN